MAWMVSATSSAGAPNASNSSKKRPNAAIDACSSRAARNQFRGQVLTERGVEPGQVRSQRCVEPIQAPRDAGRARYVVHQEGRPMKQLWRLASTTVLAEIADLLGRRNPRPQRTGRRSFDRRKQWER